MQLSNRLLMQRTFLARRWFQIHTLTRLHTHTRAHFVKAMTVPYLQMHSLLFSCFGELNKSGSERLRHRQRGWQ